MAYIDMTLLMMEQFGVFVQRKGTDCFHIGTGQVYRHQDYAIEPDVSAACYFYAMAAVLGTEVLVPGVHFDSLQGDVQFLRILEKMGCRLQERKEGIWLKGPENGRIHGIEADMHACSDQAITLAAIAPFADAPVKITGIGHIRYQESDRMGGRLPQNLADWEYHACQRRTVFLSGRGSRLRDVWKPMRITGWRWAFPSSD